MSNISERIVSRVSKPKATIAALAATATLLAGCGGHIKNEVAPTPKPTTAVAPAPTTTEATPFDSFTFQTNPERNAKIVAAVHSFGAIVLEQFKSSNSAWGPFDAFCSPGKTLGSYASGGTDEGWVSQGYKPTAGQNCYIQHNPQYGGKDMQVGADVVVGAGGVYTNQFEAVSVNNANCTATITNNGSNLGQNLGWEVQDGKTSSASTDTAKATSLAQAEAIDNQALACLAATRA
jgi:hypothetical protein